MPATARWARSWRSIPSWSTGCCTPPPPVSTSWPSMPPRASWCGASIRTTAEAPHQLARGGIEGHDVETGGGRFDPYDGRHVRGEGGRVRGVAYWGDGQDERIFVGVQQFLYALDAKTGRPIGSFGHGGRIDMRDDLRPGEKLMVSLGTPGIVYKDLLILGSRTAESLPTPPGDVRAYDVRTGTLRSE